MSTTTEEKNEIASQRIDGVRKWRDIAAQQQNGKGIVAQLHTTTGDLYKAFILDIYERKAWSKLMRRKLKSGYTNYLIWAEDYGARDGRLDTLLEASQRLRKFTIKILINICSMLWKVCWMQESVRNDTDLHNIYQIASITTEESSRIIHHIEDSSDSASDISDNEGCDNDDSHEESMQDASETLLDEIGLLLDLGPRLEEPVPDYFTREQPPALTEPEHQNPSHCFADIISTKFPQCDSTLVDVLSKSCWDSMIRLLRRREANTKGKVPSTRVSIDQATTYYSKSPDLGPSMPSNKPYANTIVSWHTKGGTTRARLPTPVKNVGQSLKFQCIACGEDIIKKNTKTWKRHLMADLRPWVCFHVSCPCAHDPFMSRQEWVQHITRNHELHPEWDDKMCPICSEGAAGDVHAAISHVEYHLEEISLAVLPCYPDGDGDEVNTTISISGHLTLNSSNIERSIGLSERKPVPPPHDDKKVQIGYQAIDHTGNRSRSKATANDGDPGEIHGYRTKIGNLWYCVSLAAKYAIFYT
ncbi:hypothetical protein F5B19DRAFT_437278 [Rostrohypoxylon terebratum]|nr:hypothetical protein F5B19DRAFT_437278 [Rostrohypoxylon terebratum]